MKYLFFLVFFSFAIGNVTAQTQVMVRAKAKNAKFIGSSIGGAKIIIRDYYSNSILAEGITKGATGNTDLLIKQPVIRGKRLTDEKTAGFLANLDIKKPTFVEIEAFAPIAKKQAVVKAATQMWILPHKDILGDGVMLEIPGFIVDILSPQTHEIIQGEFEVSANIVMMCGCPVAEGGLWDASTYEIKALLENGETAKEVELKATEKANTFSATVNLNAGNYSVTVYAFDTKTGNTGLDKTSIIVR
ncbi:hypothetical protein [Zunongwangia sp.]|uniref:hypothetical protein n=1 Tax=Zunongwangia sp. TaxID=1965325 RepID=UPI003AA83401